MIQNIGLHVKKIFCSIILFFIDVGVLWCAISFVYEIRLKFYTYFYEPMLEPLEFYNQLPIYYTIVLLFLINNGIYHKHFDFWEELKRIYRSLFIGGLGVFAYLALTKQALEFSRFVIFGTFLVLFLIFPFVKRFVKYILVSSKLWEKRVQIVGKKGELEPIKEEFLNNWYLGIKIVSNAQSVIISSRGYDINELSKISQNYMLSKKEVLFIPTLSNVNFADANIIELHNAKISLIEVKNRLQEPINKLIKVSLDFFLAILILPISFFILIVIAVLVKLDSKGSIFFKQKRMGKNSKTFYCYKFRTMYENSEHILKNYLKQNPDEREYYKIYHKYKSDPRLTRFGKWLRKTSLDELPQIINVALGQMSIIGPRPYMLNERHKLKNIKKDILLVKPGITGLWQISGRSELSFQQRVELDSWYVRNWTLWLDLIILIKTFKVVILKKGAL